MLESLEKEIIETGWSLDLPILGDESSCIGGTMGEGLEDFVVSERGAYEPCSSGEHIFLFIEKKGRTSLDILRAIERAFGVAESDVGYAGMKDKYAITRQWFSVRYLSDPSEALERLKANDWLKVLVVERHTNKIRTGHLEGNHFEVKLVGVEAADEKIEKRCSELSRFGFINYFGKQRFGNDASNVSVGLRALAGTQRLKHKELKIVISAVQSAVFNLCAAQRVERFSQEVLLGDVMQKLGGGCFVCLEQEVDAVRAANAEIVPTAPLPGNKVMLGFGQPLELESQSAQRLGLNWPYHESRVGISFNAMGKHAMGSRRTLWERPKDLAWRRLDEASGIVSFSLSSGSYATVLLRQLCGKSFRR